MPNIEDTGIKIHALPAFDDNYIWLIEYQQKAIVVDPGDADVVITALAKLDLKLNAILITHHHADHIGGVVQLLSQHPCAVYAPQTDTRYYEAFPHLSISDHQNFLIDCLDFQVMHLPGHTLDHVAYLLNQTHLFSGDVIFGAGCGRLFEGTAEQMYQSLQKIAKLNPHTYIYPAHEYTLKNLAFALSIWPDDQATKIRHAQTQQLRAANKGTLPTTLQRELNTNPFLKCNLAEVSNETRFKDLEPVEIFAQLRQWRDLF